MLLLALGFGVFLTVYVAYAASSLGRIDGLPPLPEPYWPGSVEPIVIEQRRPAKIEAKLVEAFGPDCPELKRPIRLELHSKNMVLAAGTFTVSGGRVCLVPLSVAVFGKAKQDGRGPEINSVRCKVANLTFDRPINNVSEISGRKLVEAELNGEIQIVNNRRTARRDDDLSVFILNGPLHYREASHTIDTSDHIHLIDHASRPKPHDIRGKGMTVDLLVEGPPAPGQPGPPRKAKGESISGVKRIVLQSDVVMNLYTGSNNGFPNATRPAQPAPAAKAPAGKAVAAAKGPPAAPPTKAHVYISTPGQFQYEFGKDHDLASFATARGDGGKPGNLPQFVTVVRTQEDAGTQDKLICQRLVLSLRHKEKEKKAAGPGARPAPAAPGDEAALDIETAHATGSEVIIASDAEKMSAQGNDFFYDALKGAAVLKGSPDMTAERGGSTLRARELQILEVKPLPGAGPDAKSHQEIVALGPGSIDLADKGPEPKAAAGAPARDPDKKTTHAYWNNKLTSTRDGPLDLLTLAGAARFVDDEHAQTLQAELLKVWLAPAEKKDEKGQPAAAEPKAPSATRPQHVEALGNVLAHARELNVHDCGRLVVWFRDVPVAAGAVLPAAGGPPTLVAAPMPAAQGAFLPPAAAAPFPGLVPAPAPGPAAAPAPALGPAPATAPVAKPEAPDRPIDLEAHSVEAWVLRQGERSTLEKLFTEGEVHVKQAPAKPDERGVDITGKTLQLTYHPAGNYLVVTDEEKMAHLLMGKIKILGPEVNIDQATNKSWVHGSGGMEMESTTDFQGGALDRTVPLQVYWNQDMLFKGTEGEFAEFHGDVQAEQENARLTCQCLQVFFDRPISLKEGNRPDQPARVKSLVCDRGVRVEDTTRQKDRVVKYQLIVCQRLDMIALGPEAGAPRPDGKGAGNKVRCTGPGSARVFQAGAVDPLAPPPPPGQPPAKPAQEEMKLTFVSFKGAMQANSKTNTANFYDDVRVLSLPTDNPHQEIDLDDIVGKQQLPKGAMYLRCNQLRVFDQPYNGRSNQQMDAHERVYVWAEEFSARCDDLYYNQAKDQVILDGRRTGVKLFKVAAPGGKPQVLTGKKIVYNRTTGDANVVEGDSISGDQLPGRR
jgi:lipopolysaccharide export system protein LptA